MMQKTINGINVRYCRKYNVWINKEGTYAYREYKDSTMNCPLRIHKRTNGSQYLNTKSHGEIPLDETVAICFKPTPQDGNKYVLIHKSGNLSCNHVDNLEWKQVPTFSPTQKTRTLSNGLKVNQDGTILDKGKKLSVGKSVGDQDTNRSCVPVEPFVRYYRKNRYGSTVEEKKEIDDLMAEAGFVGGDKSSMSKPKILHKDGNYLNFNSSNLQWVEEGSQEFQDYKKKKQKDKDQLAIEENPGHSNPLMKFKK